MVEPGDFEIERGMSRIISAKFTREQGSVTLVLMEPGQEPRRRRMVQSLDDPTYSYRLANVRAAAVYRVEYDGRHGENYRMTVFDFPEL